MPALPVLVAMILAIAGPVAYAQGGATLGVSVGEPQVTDAAGTPVTQATPGEVVLISSTIMGGSVADQPYVHIVRVDDVNGVTHSLTLSPGIAYAGMEAMPLAAWIPREAGEYEATVLVWESIDNPFALAPKYTMRIAVAEVAAPPAPVSPPAAPAPSIPVPPPAAPRTGGALVTIPEGTGVPGCEDAGECWLPSTIEVAPGTTVTWENNDSVLHTVTSGTLTDHAGEFSSGVIQVGATFEHTFEEAGEYPYFCIVHPWRTGTVVVGGGAPITPAPVPVVPPAVPPAAPPAAMAGDGLVVIETASGTFTIELFDDDAPNHADNLRNLAGSGYYNGTLFHRIISGFMIQGGDSNTRGGIPSTWGQGGAAYGPEDTIDAEFNDIMHVPGIVSMARSSSPDSAGSQFFIVHGDATFLDGQYTAFGRIVTDESFRALDAIAALETNSGDQPVDTGAARILGAYTVARADAGALLELGEPARTPGRAAAPAAPDPAEAETPAPRQAVVRTPEGSGVPGCEEEDTCFIPSTIEVAPGATVTWENNDVVAHTVTSGSLGPDSGDVFDSGLSLAGTTFEHTFEEAGEYPYHCIVHPWMKGTVVVGGGTPAAPEPPAPPAAPTPAPVVPPAAPTPAPVVPPAAPAPPASPAAPDPAEAETPAPRQAVVRTPEGSGVPGCEETDTCFIPSTIEVAPGATVTWENNDVVAHTVTSGSLIGGDSGDVFDSGLALAGTRFEHTFEEAGEYPYYCIVHPWMTGTVTVR